MRNATNKILFFLLFPITYPLALWIRHKMFGRNSAFMNT